MFILTAFLTLVAVYFAKREYEEYRMGWAMFWACLVGYDLHSLLNYL
jgi:hypothetical protein